MLVVFNLATGSFALAQVERQVEGAGEPTARQPASRPTTPQKPTRPGPITEVPPVPEEVPLPEEVPMPPEPALVAPAAPAAPPAPSPYPAQAKRSGHISSRKVLVIPDSDVKPEELDALTQDLLVMSHILDERFKESRTIKGVFTDFGDFFGRDNRGTEAIYMQGYGVVFLMEVNFAFSPTLKSEEQKDEETAEHVDPTWQRARQQIFSPKAPMPDMPGFSDLGFGLVKFDQLKKELIETLKHAANIRNLTPDEWIIVTVIGQGRQSGEFYQFRTVDPFLYEDYEYEDDAAASEPSTSRRRPRRPSRREGGGMMGGMYGGMGGYGGYGSYGGYGGYGGGMGGYGGGGYGYGAMGGYGGGMGMGMGVGGMYGGMGFPTATILTIRAKKSDVSDFARGELDFDQFQETVEIFTY